MNEKHELNDIILNKGTTTNPNKKIILAIATLGVILIIVVMLMNSLSSSGTDNLPQAVLPPQPQSITEEAADEEPLFEEVEVVQEENNSDADLDLIAKKLKEESQQKEEIVIAEPKVIAPKPKPKKVVHKKVAKVTKATPKKSHTKPTKVTTGSYYIQVGSFTKYEPNKKFIKSITQLGYTYKYHKVSTMNKVLVGPFNTATEARNARRILRSKVEPGAFLVKL